LSPSNTYLVSSPNNLSLSLILLIFICFVAHLSPSGIPKEDLQMDGEVVSTGDSGLEIKQKVDQKFLAYLSLFINKFFFYIKDPILADQTWYSEETKGFDNLFLNHLSIFNPGSEEVAIVKITSEYEVDGKWVTAKTR